MTERKKIKNALKIPKAEKPNKSQLTQKFLTDEQIDLLNKKHEESLSFSYIYFNRDHELFNCGGTSNGWFVELFETLKNVSHLTKKEFLYDANYNTSYDPHQHDWENIDVDKRYNFNDTYFNQYKDDCWQFRLSKSKGRVHGFVQGNVFYIIWLDPDHNFYPDEKYGGEKYYKAPLTPYQELEIEYNKVLEEKQILEELAFEDKRSSQ